MCLTCDCGDAHLEMGESNITYEDIKRAADENGRSIRERARALIGISDPAFRDQLRCEAERAHFI